MAHFAQIDENNIVTQVIIVNNDNAPDEITGQQFIASLGLEGTWLQTSINTERNKHLLGGTPLRKNFAAIGYVYDPRLDGFIPPKPTDFHAVKTNTNWTYIFNEEECHWDPMLVE